MSTAAKCDLCDALFEFEPGACCHVGYDVTTSVDKQGSPSMQGYEIDLCPKCSKPLLELLKHEEERKP